ncbi:MAG: TolC family protein [Proteobacteria bacterium]|nr:TolC family protein [Pseudomonadota bacterium]
MRFVYWYIITASYREYCTLFKKEPKKQVEILRNNSDLARLRYENGYTSYLEVHDADRSLFNGELAFAQTQGTLFRALVNLYKSMGGGVGG